MSELDLDLDAILAEFHAEENTKSPAPAPEPELRRRRAEPLPPPRSERREPGPLDGATTRYEARTEQPAARRTVPAEPVSVKTAKPRAESKPAPQREKQAAREVRAAKRRRMGQIRMAVTLAVLAALLAGLLWITLREERKNKALEPEPISVDLVAELESYLDYAATHSDGR